MQPLRWEYRPDRLRAPALICAFKGWNDAADAASTALSFVGAALGASRFATIDPEEFSDFQATRPQVKLVDGETRLAVHELDLRPRRLKVGELLGVDRGEAARPKRCADERQRRRGGIGGVVPALEGADQRGGS